MKEEQTEIITPYLGTMNMTVAVLFTLVADIPMKVMLSQTSSNICWVA
jgi:hypothetical protein